MTYGYGSQQVGMRLQIAQELPEGAAFGVAHELAGAAYAEIEKACVGAANAKKWLQAVARDKAGANQSVSWTTPDGLPVHHREMKQIRQRSKITLEAGGKPHRLSLLKSSAKVDRRRMINGISPNLVHSLDACHLRMVALAAYDEKMPVGLVHDSWSTTADKAERLFDLIREQFVVLYDGDVLGHLAKCFDTDIPAPSTGALDIIGVLSTEYSFA